MSLSDKGAVSQPVTFSGMSEINPLTDQADGQVDQTGWQKMPRRENQAEPGERPEITRALVDTFDGY